MAMGAFLLVLFAIGLIVTPFLAIYLLVRQSRLRDQLNESSEENAKRHTALHREIAELKKQIAAIQAAAAGMQKPGTPGEAAPSVPPVQHTEQAPPWPKPLVTTRPPVEKTPEPEIEKKRDAPSYVAPEPVVIPVARAIPPKPTAPEALRETKPMAPAAASSASETKAAVPTAPTEAAPPAPARSVPPTVGVPAAPPGSPMNVPASASARLTTPSPIAALRTLSPKATAQERMKKVSALEETLGTNWLHKLGIVILVVGVALFGIYELKALGAVGKVGISYIASIALLAGGVFLEKLETYRLLGRTGIGGGWALAFFSTYAINHVTSMRVLTSETADLVLMLIVALAMAAHTLRYRSQFVIGLAFLLGYTTVALSHDNVYSLSAGVVLAIGLVAIVVKMGWYELEVFGILSSYLNHLYWLYRILGIHGAQGHTFSAFRASTAMLIFYWLIFRLSYVFRSIKNESEEHISTAAALLNTMLLLGVMKFQAAHPDLAYIALAAIGFLELSLAQLSITKRRREAFVALTVMGAALMIAAVPFHYSGNNVALLWLVGTEVLLAAGVAADEIVFRRLGLLTGALVGAHLAVFDFRQLLSWREAGEALALGPGMLFALCAIVLYVNALAIGPHWRELFESEFDERLLALHSYIAAFAAAAGAWSFLGHDWTALGFAGIMLVLAALGRVRGSIHLQAQYALLGAISLYRALIFNLHIESPYPHVKMRLVTLPILAAAFYLTAKLAALRDDAQQRAFRNAFAAAGTVLFGLLLWYEVPELWQPLALIGFAVLLAEAGRWLRDHALAWHAHAITAIAVYTALTADQFSPRLWHSIPVHAFAALPVVAGSYLLAKRIAVSDARHLEVARGAYTWIGTGVMVWVLEEALHAPWIAVGWIVFAVLLALSAKWVRYSQLAWQANAVAVCSFVRVISFNYSLEQSFWHGISLRIVTVALVAAGLYFLSRKAAPEESYNRPIAFLHSFAATGLLTLLAWYEAPNGWVAPIWAAFAVVLAIIDRRWNADELPWQAHALAALSVARSLVVNLHITSTWHNMSVRLLSLTLVGVILYGLSRLVRMPDSWRERDFHHVYSWAASTIVSLMLWYELQPLSIAVGWAVFGLVLFEYGLLRKIPQLRYQAYVALMAAFARIFFANLTAGEPGVFWSPRMYTIAPLALIFFFVYAQLPGEEENVAGDRRLHFDILLGYLGTATVMALFYFQFPIEWVVTSWAAIGFVLFGLALLLNRPMFLHQALLLTGATFARGMMHNLFGAGYFGKNDWTGRYFVLGSAVAILLASLVFALPLHERYGQPTETRGIRRKLAFIIRRPEQLQFFAPVILLTFMLALKMRAGMVTVAWGIEGVFIVLLALALKERSYRLTGLGVLLLCVGKVMAMDAWGLQPRDRYITFIIVGIALLLVSFLYTRYRDTIRQFL